MKGDFVSLSPKNAWLWFLLAFQAGAINAGGFIAFGRFVTHTTGFATHFAFELAHWRILDALGMLAVPLFFLLGAMISSFFVDLRHVRGEPANFRIPAALIFLCLLLASVLGEAGLFGVFGDEYKIAKDYSFMVLLCLASGLQNALIVHASGVVVRTTHLTGVTTDLAMGLVRLLFAEEDQRHERHGRLANLARLGIIAGFVLGSAVSSFLFLRAEYWGFLLPACTSFFMLVYFIRRT